MCCHYAALCVAAIMHAPTIHAIAQTDNAPPPPTALTSLHFSPAPNPAPVEPTSPTENPVGQSALNFDPEAIIAPGLPPTSERQSPLTILTELMLIRAKAAQSPPPETEIPDAIDVFSLRFQDSLSEQSLWSQPDAAANFGRWEVLPDLYLRSGRVLDVGYESLDYADLYAELGVDLTSNTGLWLRYERLRQALGSGREGEQVDADALYLQFELRF